eukprot:1166023-Prymnesium_polylepis.1
MAWSSSAAMKTEPPPPPPPPPPVSRRTNSYCVALESCSSSTLRERGKEEGRQTGGRRRMTRAMMRGRKEAAEADERGAGEPEGAAWRGVRRAHRTWRKRAR